MKYHILHELSWALPLHWCWLCLIEILPLPLPSKLIFLPYHVLSSIFALALALGTDIFALSCFVINFCPCPCPSDWYFCPIFSGVVFALAHISSMFSSQCLPLPLPSQLPFRVMAITTARARANISGKTWGKWGQGQKRRQNHKLLECPP